MYVTNEPAVFCLRISYCNMYAMEWPLLGNVQALELSVPVSPVMATQPKAKNTVYSTVRPEAIYLRVVSE
jgi:hypothetical protein